jgi:hypothetical protein
MCFAVLSVFALGHLSLSSATAQVSQDEPEFFMSLEDIPLMEGLEELEDQTLSFDKPEGRIIESLALMRGVSRQQVLSYYRQALPHFGWQVMEGGTMFFRGKEYLDLTFHQKDGISVVKIMVKPTL